MRGAKWAGTTGLLLACACACIAPVQAACEKGYVATFKVKPGDDAAFATLLVALAAKVRSGERGNLMYQPYRGAAEGEYVILERYIDAAARDAHGDSAAIKETFPKLLPMLREPLKVVAISALDCGSK